jgi:hypothetical protein
VIYNKLTEQNIDSTKKTGDLSFWTKVQACSLVSFIGFFVLAVFSEHHLLYFFSGSIALSINIYSFYKRWIKVRKTKLIERMLRGVGLIMFGLHSRLTKRYTTNYGLDFSGRLATAVINELFFETPQEEDGRIFAEENQSLIKEKIAELKNDEQVKYVVTQTLRVMSVCDGYSEHNVPKKTTYEKWLNNFEKAVERGVFIEGGDAPIPDAFLSFASEFYDSSPSLDYKLSQNL